MSKRNNQIQKANLALAMAAGSTVRAWADANGVAERTARTWSHSQEVLDQVEAIPREIVHCTIGRLSDNATRAFDSSGETSPPSSNPAARGSAALWDDLDVVGHVHHERGTVREVLPAVDGDRVRTDRQRTQHDPIAVGN